MCQQTSGAFTVPSTEVTNVAINHAKMYAPLMACTFEAMVATPRENLLNPVKLRELASVLSLIRRESNSATVEAQTASFLLYDIQVPLERRLAAAFATFVQEIRGGTAVKLAQHEISLADVSFGRDRCVPMMSRECLICFDLVAIPLQPPRRLRWQYSIRHQLRREPPRKTQPIWCSVQGLVHCWSRGVHYQRLGGGLHSKRKKGSEWYASLVFVFVFLDLFIGARVCVVFFSRVGR